MNNDTDSVDNKIEEFFDIVDPKRELNSEDVKARISKVMDWPTDNLKKEEG